MIQWLDLFMNSIKIYSTVNCAYCKMAKDYLKDKGFEYEEFDVGTNVKSRNEMFEKTHQMGVPVIDINGKIIIGFKKEEIDSALKIH